MVGDVNDCQNLNKHCIVMTLTVRFVVLQRIVLGHLLMLLNVLLWLCNNIPCTRTVLLVGVSYGLAMGTRPWPCMFKAYVNSLDSDTIIIKKRDALSTNSINSDLRNVR